MEVLELAGGVPGLTGDRFPDSTPGAEVAGCGFVRPCDAMASQGCCGLVTAHHLTQEYAGADDKAVSPVANPAANVRGEARGFRPSTGFLQQHRIHLRLEFGEVFEAEQVSEHGQGMLRDPVSEGVTSGLAPHSVGAEAVVGDAADHACSHRVVFDIGPAPPHREAGLEQSMFEASGPQGTSPPNVPGSIEPAGEELLKEGDR